MTNTPDHKSDNALRTIGELAAETGIATHILRYWERHVPALQPLRRAGGRRYYRADDVALIRRLHHLIEGEGYTLEGAARALRSPRGRPVASAAPAEASPVLVTSAPTVPQTAMPLFADAVSPHPAGPAVDVEALIAIRNRLRRALAA
jgi:DNA-binding transcriptional MerR regulator